jgi:hypothetical protein
MSVAVKRCGGLLVQLERRHVHEHRRCRHPVSAESIEDLEAGSVDISPVQQQLCVDEPRQGGGCGTTKPAAFDAQRSTEHRAGRPQTLAQRAEAPPFDLAPGGVCPATPVTWSAVSLIHHARKPLTSDSASGRSGSPPIVREVPSHHHRAAADRTAGCRITNAHCVAYRKSDARGSNV